MVMIFYCISGYAQNIQLHYDFGKDRQMLTSTVEFFKADKIGSTYFFVDMDYGKKSSDVSGIDMAYWEISRSFKFNNCYIEPRIEYNGGLLREESTAYGINNCYLVGIQHGWNNTDFTKIFTLQLNYKYIQDLEDASFQITGVWEFQFFERKLTCSGFADFWKEEHSIVDDNGNWSTADYVFITEPQFWYNACKSLSVGTEIELSTNFGTHDGFMINPTLAVKWKL